MLSFTDVSHQYQQTIVIDHISFVLGRGQILAIVGPSGCGKTTLLNIAANLITPSQGQVDNKFQQTAYVFQDPRLLPWRTTGENMTFGLKAQGVPVSERRQLAEQLAEQLGLQETLDKYPHQLSGGMRQRTAIGRALAIQPDLLLLDEPFSALDVGLRHELQNLTLELLAHRGVSALFVTHDLAEAVRMGDKMMVLSPTPGQVAYHWQQQVPSAQRSPAYLYETASRLLQNPQVADCFNVCN